MPNFRRNRKMKFFALNDKLNQNEVLTKKEANIIFAYTLLICLLSAMCSVGLSWAISQIRLLNILADTTVTTVLLSVFRFISIVGQLLCGIYFWKLIFLLAFRTHANFKKAFYGRNVQ